MDFSSISSLARQNFYQEIQQPSQSINLAKAALYIAQEEYPNLDVEESLHAIDVMATDVQERLPVEAYPLRIIQTINSYLYQDLGFSGNTVDYYDPRNSYLNEVIDRRTGIPITLSLLYLEIARRINFPMVGVGLPGHFLIRPILPDMEVFVDAFNGGEVMFVEDCQERLQQIYGRTTEFHPDYLEAIDPPRFLARMLTNLKYIYINRDDGTKALAAIDRILLLFPHTSQELRDRGLIHYQLGHWSNAAHDLEAYLSHAPNAPDAIAIRDLLQQIQSDENR